MKPLALLAGPLGVGLLSGPPFCDVLAKRAALMNRQKVGAFKHFDDVDCLASVSKRQTSVAQLINRWTENKNLE
jgi:hypothetical protein